MAHNGKTPTEFAEISGLCHDGMLKLLLDANVPSGQPKPSASGTEKLTFQTDTTWDTPAGNVKDRLTHAYLSAINARKVGGLIRCVHRSSSEILQESSSSLNIRLERILDDSPKNKLVVDSQNDPAADGFLGWVVTIVICYATLLSPILVYSPGQETTSETVSSAVKGTNYLNQIFWLGLFASTIFMIWLRRVRILAVLAGPTVIAIAAFMLVAFLSALWSPVPYVALRRALAQTILIATIFLPIASTHNYARQIDRVTIVFLIVAIVNVIPISLFPPSSLGHIGIYSHKNELGLVMAFAFIFCLYAFLQFKGFLRFISFLCIPLSLVELWLSQSKTSFGLAILIPLISAFALAFQSIFNIAPIYTILIGFFISIPMYFYCSYLFDFSFSDVSMIMFGDPTFTGRTVIWDFLSGVIAREPLLGQGYGSFWDAGDWSILKREAPGYIVFLLQGHNGYIDIIVDLGIVGFCLFTVAIAAVMYNVGSVERYNKNSSRIRQWLFFNILLFAIFHNFLESSWFRGYELVWILFLAIGFWAQQAYLRESTCQDSV